MIEAVLPRGLFRARLESGKAITAALSGEARRITVQLVPGDRVSLSISPRDPTRGRILGKLP